MCDYDGWLNKHGLSAREEDVMHELERRKTKGQRSTAHCHNVCEVIGISRGST